MRLYEFEGKQLFQKLKIPIPDGKLASSSDEVHAIVSEMGGSVAIKSQVLTGGRGKAGGIKIVSGALL